MKNVVLIGGGTGLSAMVKGFKNIEDVNLTAIITVADDGGSTGRIRDAYNVPAMGDIRHVLCAMAKEEEDSIFTELMNYRFVGDQDVGGHQLGNLIFLALINITGSFMGAIASIRKLLNVEGTIYPATLDNAVLYALMGDGTLVRGEKNIPSKQNHISKVFYQDQIHAYPEAIEAIQQADLIAYGIGSLYTSILPAVIVKDISEAIAQSLAPKVYFCNAMTQPGETEGYSLEDHVRAIEAHTYKNPVSLVVYNDAKIEQDVSDRYAKLGSTPVQMQEEDHMYQVISKELTVVDETGRIRHDSDKLAQCLVEILESIEKESYNVIFK